jgi:4-alpha-glucanotransferase
MSLLQYAFGNDPRDPRSGRITTLATWPPTPAAMTTIQRSVGGRVPGVGESTRTVEDIRKERGFTRAYLGFENERINWVFIRTVLASIAGIAMIPLQDVLGLGTEARVNLPGTVSGNWKWRFRPKELTPEIKARLKELTLAYDR